MNVEQLGRVNTNFAGVKLVLTRPNAALQQMPGQAVVLLEGDAGYSLVGVLAFEENGNGVPDEVILLPSMEDD